MTEQLKQALELYRRNGRWGTCVDCPQDADGRPLPELCTHTTRYDHLLEWTALDRQIRMSLEKEEKGAVPRDAINICLPTQAMIEVAFTNWDGSENERAAFAGGMRAGYELRLEHEKTEQANRQTINTHDKESHPS